MPIICRLLALTPAAATGLAAQPDSLEAVVAAAASYSDVYRYWHGIQYLLAQHQPGSIAARYLELGQAIASPAVPDVPPARLLLPAVVAQLETALRDVAPDDLADYYEAADFDAAGIYPHCWERWEETFDPLGQMLEHAWFLLQFVRQCAARGDALLLYFVFLDDGSDDEDDADEG